MPLTANSLAEAVGASVKNTQFQATSQNVSHKNLLIGTYDPLILTITDDVPALILSPEDAANKYGPGFMLHRMAIASFAGSGGVETWVIPQAEVAGVQAAGDIDFTGSVPTENGTIYLYIAGDIVPVVILATDDEDAIATKVVAAIALDDNLPVTAVVNGVTTAQVDFTSKSEGTYGNFISLTFNWGFQEVLPAGVVAAVTDMASGAGIPDIQDALDALGTADDQNLANFTEVVDGYGTDTTTLDIKSTYNGAGNDFVGNYSKTVARPFRSLTGSVATGSAALTTLLALANGRKQDRTNGAISVEGSPDHPVEIACLALGIMSVTNNERAAESYHGKILPGVIPGNKADRWSNTYDSKDTAVKAGVSPTLLSGNSVTMSDTLTFYHPDNVPLSSNGYRSQRNISITQNVLFNEKLTFSQEKWRSISIVADVANVTNSVDKQKVKDRKAVLGELIALATAFEGQAWLFSAAFTIAKLQSEPSRVQIRAGGTGFDILLPVVYSGESGIIDTVTEFDTSLAVFL